MDPATSSPCCTSTAKSNAQRTTVVLFWLLVIAFSSTSAAGHWADVVFDRVAGAPFLHFRTLDPYRRSMIHFLAEKDIHLCMYAVFSALLYWSLGFTRSKALLVLGIGCAVGIGSELFQRFFPARDPSLRDVAINFAGTCLGVVICLVAVRLRRRTALSPKEPSWRSTT